MLYGMRVKYTKNAAEDILYFKQNDQKIYLRIKKLIDEIVKTPFKDIGKPEALKYGLSGKWSRRITREHRIIYEIKCDQLIIYQCRYHY